jgi:Peptidase family M23
MSNEKVVNNKPLQIYTNGGRRRIKNASEINEHHDGPAYSEKVINGKKQRVRSDGGGFERVVVDFVAKDKNGSQAVDIPAPVGGTVTLVPAAKSGGYGNMVEIRNDQGQVIARIAHLEKFDPNIKSGDVIGRGTLVGVQGSTGRSSGPHVHIEMPPDALEEYIEDIQSGVFRQDSNSNEQIQEPITSETNNTCHSNHTNYEVVDKLLEANHLEMANLGLNVISNEFHKDAARMAYATINGLDRAEAMAHSNTYKGMEGTAAEAYKEMVEKLASQVKDLEPKNSNSQLVENQR